MKNKVKTNIILSPPPPPPRVQVGDSRLLLQLFLGVVLLISFSRCGGDTPEPTSQPNTPTTNTNTPNPVVKSKDASINKISFTVNGKNYAASISEETLTVTLPYGESIPSEVTIASLEYTPEAEPSVKQGGNLTVNDGKATITITAEDQTTTKTYSINFLTELGVKVIFNVNDDITAIPPLDLKKGGKASRPDTDPTPSTGKSFGYWTAIMGTTPANYGKDLFDFETTPINEDITLYAVWQEKPADKDALIALIDTAIDDQGDSPNLNFIDTGLITDMKELFIDKSIFNGDISGWDTSKVTTMEKMFAQAHAFNQDIGDWNTANVTNMVGIFSNTNAFNQDIGDWDTGKVTTMKNMFFYARDFNQDIGDWNTANVINMEAMFNYAAAFNQNIGNWNTANVTNMSGMFSNAFAFNQYIGDWNTGEVTNMEGMFFSANVFNQNIENWNTANVTTMKNMFYGVWNFNQNIGDWDTSKVTDMSGMFSSVDRFNKDIGDWDTSKVTTMKDMFKDASDFDQDISEWIVTQITDYADIFKNCGIREEYKPTRFRTNDGN